MKLVSRVAALLVPALGLLAFQKAGEPLPPWNAGTLDIHHIQTGRGNAAFLVFPNGTTLLLDAGAVPERGGALEIGPQRPNASRSVAEWIAAYIRQFSPKQQATLDYAVITHYHDDHMGALPQLAARIPIRKLIDRGLDPAPPTYPVVRSYLEFRGGFKGAKEALVPGRSDQITAGGAEVRNVAANGVVWTGKGNAAVSAFPADWRNLPEALRPAENSFSLALLVRYGRFRYFSGGDLAGVPLDDLPSWHDLETPVAKAVGRVDALVLNHHGWLDSTNEFFLRTLRPRVVVIPAWHATHPDHGVLRRLRSPAWKPAPPDLFLTSLLDAPRAIFSYLKQPFQSTEGHVLIRVAASGSFQVIVLDNGLESPLVKSVFGPY